MKQLTKKQMQDFVTIVCYGQPEIMRRDEAIAKYYDGMMCCEGSESLYRGLRELFTKRRR